MKFEIGGIVIGSEFKDKKRKVIIDKTYQLFFSSKKPDILVNLHKGRLPCYPFERKVFTTKGAWNLFQDKDKYIFHLPSLRLVVNKSFSRADFYQSLNYKDENHPLTYPLDQLLMLGFLAKGNGVLCHACAIKYKNKGFLFLGESGAGKSTLAGIWQNCKGAEVLSDDRIIIRRQGLRYLIYGTPWQGLGQFSSPKKAILSKIFFLKQAPKNSLIPIPLSLAAARFFSCSFPPFWDKEGMRFVLDFFIDLVGRNPVYELGFLPRKSAVDFVKDFCERKNA